MRTTRVLRNFRKKALAASIASAILLGQDVLAQAVDRDIEEIAVTGTRVRMTDGMASPVPVTAVSIGDLQNFDPGGSVSEQLSNLPQFFGTQSAQRGGGILFGSGGGSYMNMRNLGAVRTLVLFDGSRIAPADKRGSVNIDTIPTALVRSVDVVTGGASAAYGADALGGVVNFVLDRQFEGLKVEVGSGINEWGDGQRWNVGVAGGTQIGDRLHLIGSIQSLEIKEIQRDPEDLGDWYQRWGWVTNPAWTPGNTSVPQRLTRPWVASSEHSPYGMIWARTGTSSTSPMHNFSLNGTVFLPDGSGTRPFVKGDVYAAPWATGSTKSMSGGTDAMVRHKGFNAYGANGVVNRSFFTGLQYELTDDIAVFGQVLWGRSESSNTAARGGYEISDGWHMNIYRNNAFLPPSVAAAMDAANNGAGIQSFQLWRNGGFIDDLNKEVRGRDYEIGVFGTYSWSAGFEATLPNDWDLRASWQSGESHKRTGVYDNFRPDRMALAMDAVRDPATGKIVCNVQLFNPTPAQLAAAVVPRLASPGGSPGGTGSFTTTAPLASPVGLDNSIRDCIPYNALATGRASAEVIDYMSTPKMGDSMLNQDFAEILLTGELIQGWAGPVSFASGLTWREQDFFDNALPTSIDVLGPPLNAPQIGIRGLGPGWTSGSANLHSFSTVPKVDGAYDVWEYFAELNAPLWESGSGQQTLGGSASFRSSTYSSLADPIDSWKIGLDFQVFEDLRVRVTKSRDVREATLADRFDAQSTGGNINDPRFNGQVFATTITRGGNPDLIPEQANTVVFGFIYEPAWFNGFRMSLDWFDIQINDAIGVLGQQRIVNECEINKVQELCAQIQRDPTTQVVGRIFDVPLNVSQAKVNGVDLEFAYTMEPDFFASEAESLTVRGFAGYIGERMDIPFGATTGLDLAGALGTPDLTGNVTVRYDISDYSIQLQQRYIASTIMDPLWVEGRDVDVNSVSSGNYTNMRIGYNGELANGATWDLGFNINNLLDRNPPIIAGFGTRGGSQQVNADYEIFGRQYQLNLNMTF